MVKRLVIVMALGTLFAGGVPARADGIGAGAGNAVASDTFVLHLTGTAHHHPWQVQWVPEPEAARTPPSPFASFTITPAAADAQATRPAPRPVAYDYSDAYMTRAKIHRYASWATLPLFAATYFSGEQLYDGDFTEGQKSFHSSMITASAILFGLNSATGVWNLWEGRKDPNHRTRRMVHGILMLAADAGFVATGASAPDFEEGRGEDRSTHRSLAITSMGIATTSYLIMLLSR